MKAVKVVDFLGDVTVDVYELRPSEGELHFPGWFGWDDDLYDWPAFKAVVAPLAVKHYRTHPAAGGSRRIVELICDPEANAYKHSVGDSVELGINFRDMGGVGWGLGKIRSR